MALVSTNQARIHGLLPRKGVLSPGADGDVVLWDPLAEISVDSANRHGGVDYTPYAGMTLTGAASAVFVRGTQVFDGSEIVGTPGFGRFVRR